MEVIDNITQIWVNDKRGMLVTILFDKQNKKKKRVEILYYLLSTYVCSEAYVSFNIA